MLSRNQMSLGALAVFVAVGVVATTLDAQSGRTSTAAGQPRVEEVIAHWKPMPQEAARKLTAKYGQPQEITSERLIWHDNGPWRITELVNEEIQHDFPMPHKDMLKQAIDYKVDPDKGDELLNYDGSVVLERTKGMIAARCDKEEANFLALNLANDIATGKRSVGDARRFYAESIMAFMKQGKPNEYMTGLRFSAAKGDHGDPDKPAGPVGTSGR